MTYGVCWKSLEKVDGSIVKLNQLLALLIAGIAIRLECTDACSVCLPFVLP